jgi:hypothetical protein
VIASKGIFAGKSFEICKDTVASFILHRRDGIAKDPLVVDCVHTLHSSRLSCDVNPIDLKLRARYVPANLMGSLG